MAEIDPSAGSMADHSLLNSIPTFCKLDSLISVTEIINLINSFIAKNRYIRTNLLMKNWPLMDISVQDHDSRKKNVFVLDH